MNEFKFSKYFQEEFFPISVEIMPAAGVEDESPLHSHEFSELVIVGEGRITHRMEEGDSDLKKGDFFLIHPGGFHSYKKASEDAIIYNLIYDAAIPIPMLMMCPLSFLQQIYPAQKSDFTPYTGIISHVPDNVLSLIVASLERIRYEVETREAGHHALITSLFMEIVLLLARYYSHDEPDDPEWALNKVIAFLKCHYKEKITTKVLMKIAGMSESTLLRKFKSTFGIGPAEYLADLRVRQAVTLLKNRSLTIDAVAAQCGFCDSSHLWKVMKNKLDKTPQDIRKSHNAASGR